MRPTAAVASVNDSVAMVGGVSMVSARLIGSRGFALETRFGDSQYSAGGWVEPTGPAFQPGRWAKPRRGIQHSRGFSAIALASLEYWIVRSSRAERTGQKKRPSEK